MSDPYVYPESGALVNRLSEHNKASLHEAEALLSGLRIRELIKQSPPEAFDFDYLKSLHKYAFQDIYPDWAGEVRTILTHKKEAVLDGGTVKYAAPEAIVAKADRLFKSLPSVVELQNLDTDELAPVLSEQLISLWQIHPFREGNTRVIFLMFYHLSIAVKRPLSLAFLHKNHRIIRQALVKSANSDKEEFNRLIKFSILRHKPLLRIIDFPFRLMHYVTMLFLSSAFICLLVFLLNYFVNL